MDPLSIFSLQSKLNNSLFAAEFFGKPELAHVLPLLSTSSLSMTPLAQQVAAAQTLTQIDQHTNTLTQMDQQSKHVLTDMSSTVLPPLSTTLAPPSMENDTFDLSAVFRARAQSLTSLNLPMTTHDVETNIIYHGGPYYCSPTNQTYNTNEVEPRDAMRRQMFQQYQLAANMQHRAREMAAQQMMPPNAVEESKAKPARQRKRKPAANAKTKKTQASPAAQNPSFPHNPMPTNFTSMGYQDVMVVGEPSMMGGDFGQQDERTISRIENTQYDPSSVRSMQGSMNGMQNMHGASNGMGMGGVPAGMGAMGAAQGLPMTSQSMSMPPMGPPSGQMTPSQVPSGQMTPVSMPPGSMAPPAHLTNLGGPPQNGMPPPGYTFANGQPGTWPGAPPNATMITG